MGFFRKYGLDPSPLRKKKQINQFKGWPLATAFVKGCVGILFQHQRSLCMTRKQWLADTVWPASERRGNTIATITIGIMNGTRPLIISYHLI